MDEDVPKFDHGTSDAQSPGRVQAHLHVSARAIVRHSLVTAEQTARNRRGFQPLLQHDLWFALRHELAAVDQQTTARGPQAGMAPPGIVPTGEVTRRQHQCAGAELDDLLRVVRIGHGHVEYLAQFAITADRPRIGHDFGQGLLRVMPWKATLSYP